MTNVRETLSTDLAHALIRNSVCPIHVLDGIRLPRGLKVALVTLDQRLLVDFHVDLQCDDSNGDKIAQFAFVGANLGVLFQNVADDLLSAVGLAAVCLEAAEVADPTPPCFPLQ